MDEIQTNFEKIMYEINSSLTHSAPRKLDFGSFNESLNDSNAAKRKATELENGSNSNSSLDSSVDTSKISKPSPWETKRIKLDLADAQMRIISLKDEIERQYKLFKEKEIDYELKITKLKDQNKFANEKVDDVESHLQSVRKREQAAQQEVLRLQKNKNQTKRYYETLLKKLQDEKEEAEETARQAEMTLLELNECRRHAERLESDYNSTYEELEMVKASLEDYKTRADAYEALKLDYERQQIELECSKTRIQQLEAEIASNNEWNDITKAAEQRLLRLPDLDRELERLRSSNKHLRDHIGNKLLLEEQVYDLRTRLEKYEGAHTEAVSLQVKLKHAEKELKEWIKVGQDHCLPNTVVTCVTLRARIEQLLENDISTAAERSGNASMKKAMTEELMDYKQKCEIYSKNIEELNVALRRHKNLKDRVQKRLLLVSKERDCYKQLLDNFEKDLTVSNMTATEHSNTETQMRMRIDMLEKTLSGYKEMCANLEKEVEYVRSTGENAIGAASNENETYAELRKQVDTLRVENERLQRRKEQLELELEHRFLRGDFGVRQHKILHFDGNPANEAFKNSNDLIEKLQAEIERLKRRNRQLEEDNEITQARLNESSNLTMNIKELNRLRAELESNNMKMKKIKEAYKSASMEFREVCYMLFGYRVDRSGTVSNYKISSMYAESPDDYINFRLNDSSVLELLETPYSATLQPLIETHLVGNKSLPVFLSSLTLELFARTTITSN